MFQNNEWLVLCSAPLMLTLETAVRRCLNTETLGDEESRGLLESLAIFTIAILDTHHYHDRRVPRAADIALRPVARRRMCDQTTAATLPCPRQYQTKT